MPEPKKRSGYHRKYQRQVGRELRRESTLDRTKRLIAAAYRVWALKNGVTD